MVARAAARAFGATPTTTEAMTPNGADLGTPAVALLMSAYDEGGASIGSEQIRSKQRGAGSGSGSQWVWAELLKRAQSCVGWFRVQEWAHT
jgi:hypothetical protein